LLGNRSTTFALFDLNSTLECRELGRILARHRFANVSFPRGVAAREPQSQEQQQRRILPPRSEPNDLRRAVGAFGSRLGRVSELPTVRFSFRADLKHLSAVRVRKIRQRHAAALCVQATTLPVGLEAAADHDGLTD
jgi:hypothetical protein